MQLTAPARHGTFVMRAVLLLIVAWSSLAAAEEVVLFEEEFHDSLLRPKWDIYAVDSAKLEALPLIDLRRTNDAAGSSRGYCKRIGGRKGSRLSNFLASFTHR